MVEIKKELLAPCGLYCGVCAVQIADRTNNIKFKKAILNSNVYKGFAKKLDDIKCVGCLSEKDEDIFGFCQQCPIRDCVSKKKIEGCHQCDEFPCKWLKRFPVPIGRKVIMRAIPYRKEHGTQKWIEHEEERYHCPECGNPLYRGARRCNKCKASVNVDI